jgi:hypothetical protein
MSQKARQFIVSFNPEAPVLEDRYVIQPSARELTIACTVIQVFHSLEQAADFALNRHGMHNTDIMAGVTYPCELCESEEIRGAGIPEGFLEIYICGFSSEQEESYCIMESEYLELLRQILVIHKKHEMAARIEQFQSTLQS